MTSRARRNRSRWRWALFFYAIALTTATHWPQFQMAAPFEGTDLVAHVLAFGLLTVLIIAARLFAADALSTRNLLLSLIVGVVWSGIDEWTQGLPFVNRHVTWSDFFANVVGVCIVVFAAFIWRVLRRAGRKNFA